MQFQLKIDDEEFQIDDPIPTGRQLLELASRLPTNEHLIFQETGRGLLEELRLDETLDLRSIEQPRFKSFKSDRSFRLVIDGRRFEWGAAGINGATLKRLAGVDIDSHSIWLELQDQPDRFIEDAELVSLEEPHVEVFRTEPSFTVCIEDSKFSWPKATITTEEIIQQGGWDPSQGVIEVNEEDQTERTLSPGEIIQLKPGYAFGKIFCWKRGLLDGSRLEAELNLLRTHYCAVDHKHEGSLHWIQVKPIHLKDNCALATVAAVFYLTEGYPGTAPYGFFIPANVLCGEKVPKSNNTNYQPPFPGVWRFISWQPTDWRPTADVQGGDNLWGWVRGFKNGLEPS